MYPRSIERILRLQAIGRLEDQEYEAREQANNSFERGAYLAQYPHRDYPESMRAFADTIHTITTRIHKTRWKRCDYLLIMQCYERLVTHTVCSRLPDSQATAAMWLEKAMKFYRDETKDQRPNTRYLQTIYAACLACAYGKYENSILSSNPLTNAEINEIFSIAADMIEIINVQVEQPVRLQLTADERRELASRYVSLSSLYRIIADQKNMLKYLSMGIHMLETMSAHEKTTEDFLAISKIYIRNSLFAVRSPAEYPEIPSMLRKKTV